VSGRKVLVERAHDFILGPWPPTPERQIETPFSGIMRKAGTSWKVGRERWTEHRLMKAWSRHRVDAMTDVENAAIAVVITTCAAADVGDWAELRTELWPDGTISEHLDFAAAAIGEPARLVAFLARDDDDRLLGFAEASLRSDYVNGCSTSPVAFLEGLYVRGSVRRKGIGRGLIAAIELWARERGCAELASDALIGNAVSHHVMKVWGFVETERVVFFRKDLDIPETQ